MQTTSASPATTTAASDTLTAFVTVAGIDLVLRKDGREHRARAVYDSMFTLVDGEHTTVSFTDDDDVLAVKLGDSAFELRLQPKGHYFTWLQPLPPKADACDITEARRLFRAAQKAKTAKK